MRSVLLLLPAVLSVVVSGCGASPSSTPSTPSPVAPAQLTADAVVSLLVVGTPPARGASSQFAAIAFAAGGASQAVTSLATWSSSNTAIATVGKSGVVTAVEVGGPVEISATYGTAKGSLTFSVSPVPTYRLTGLVTDAASGQALPGAVVTVKDARNSTASAATDALGRYAIAGVPGGAVDVTVTATGHVPVTRRVNVLGDMTLDVALPRASSCPALGFDELLSHGARFTTYTACGFTVGAVTENWTVSTSYGRPAPFIQFVSSAGTTTLGEVVVTAGGAKFKFASADVYSSTTPIPYVITGIANSASLFSFSGTQGNTFGNFATISNPHATTLIDALVIRLTNPAAACCTNPVGLDNIVLVY